MIACAIHPVSCPHSCMHTSSLLESTHSELPSKALVHAVPAITVQLRHTHDDSLGPDAQIKWHAPLTTTPHRSVHMAASQCFLSPQLNVVMDSMRCYVHSQDLLSRASQAKQLQSADRHAALLVDVQPQTTTRPSKGHLFATILALHSAPFCLLYTQCQKALY